ncbi:MAG: DegV family protein, partial [Acidimicrobiales bacterium]
MVTDSTAMLPRWLRQELRVKVVPVGLVLDGRPSVDEDSDAMDEVLAQLRAGATLATASPAPGEFAAAFEEAGAEGADEVLAIHAAASFSSTLLAARLAAAMVDVRVQVMDSGQAAFALGCCVWRAAELVRAGGSCEHAEAMVEVTSGSVRSVFTAAEIRGPSVSGYSGSGLAPEEPRGVPLVVAG